MIAQITGSIIFAGERFLVVETGGVGYKVYVTTDVLTSLGASEERVTFWTYLHVRESALDLYGFKTYAEMQFFEVLLSVSGVGPKSALGVMSVAPLDMLKRAIASGDITYLTKVSGVGKRMAEKVVLELKDKLGGGALDVGAEADIKADTDVLDALTAMGYSTREVREVVGKLPQSIIGTKNRLSEALKILGGKN
jgi:holliday junction DNA helicase RuvA